jgi:agmatine/peptidylarginine deiminase
MDYSQESGMVIFPICNFNLMTIKLRTATILFLCLLFAKTNSEAQSPLPRFMTEEERAIMSEYSSNRVSGGGIVTPPNSPVRTMAEWEEIESLIISWEGFTGILSQIAFHAKQECEVIIVSQDSNSVKNTLTTNGVDFIKKTFIEAPTNSVWVRDYGPWNIYTNDVDSLLIVDWIYNRPRPLDDLLPEVIASYKNLPHYEMTTAPNDLVHTGGNFMVDGLGTGFSSELVLDENWNGNFNITNKTTDEIDTLMKQFMGIDRFIKMNTLPYDGIHHIDMHMKLLDEETLLVGEYPTGVADGPQIEANIAYVLDNYPSIFGTPYKVKRIIQPPDQSGQFPNSNGDYRTYANAVFVNKTIIVPIYEQQYDTTAMRIWKELMPGYKIAGIDADAMIWASGAIHCITKPVATNDPLLIVHQPIRDQGFSVDDFEVNALIRHRSGIQSAEVYFRTDTTAPYQSTSMTITNITNNTWSGDIPSQLAGTEVYYYVYATANSGKEQVRPMPAPEGYWHFEIFPVTAINELASELFDFNDIYPNPSKGITVIPIETTHSFKGKLSVKDVFCRTVFEIYDGHFFKGAKNFFINTFDWEAGVYIVVLESSNYEVTKKLIVR